MWDQFQSKDSPAEILSQYYSHVSFCLIEGYTVKNVKQKDGNEINLPSNTLSPAIITFPKGSDKTSAWRKDLNFYAHMHLKTNFVQLSFHNLI